MTQQLTSARDLVAILATQQSPRRSFLPITPAHATVLEALVNARQAHGCGDMAAANAFLVDADVIELSDYVLRIIGKVDARVHRQSTTPPASVLLPKSQQVGMPSSSEQRRVFLRDSWHCRCCGIPVVAPEARRRLSAVHSALRSGKRNHERHAGVFALMASLDHALPRSRGGSNDDDNLVTACWPCQFGRMDWTYDEVEMADPRIHHSHPRLAGWEGLTSCR